MWLPYEIVSEATAVFEYLGTGTGITGKYVIPVVPVVDARTGSMPILCRRAD